MNYFSIFEILVSCIVLLCPFNEDDFTKPELSKAQSLENHIKQIEFKNRITDIEWRKMELEERKLVLEQEKLKQQALYYKASLRNQRSFLFCSRVSLGLAVCTTLGGALWFGYTHYDLINQKKN